jgi:hypothetical protein
MRKVNFMVEIAAEIDDDIARDDVLLELVTFEIPTEEVKPMSPDGKVCGRVTSYTTQPNPEVVRTT